MVYGLQHEKKFLQDDVQGHIHFVLFWNGNNPPNRTIMQFPITGTVRPKIITVVSNTG